MKLSVPVTKLKPLTQIKFVIDKFIKDKLTFGLLEKHADISQIWRAPLSGEKMRERNDNSPGQIIQRKHPKITEFSKIWVKGVETNKSEILN